MQHWQSQFSLLCRLVWSEWLLWYWTFSIGEKKKSYSWTSATRRLQNRDKDQLLKEATPPQKYFRARQHKPVHSTFFLCDKLTDWAARKKKQCSSDQFKMPAERVRELGLSNEALPTQRTFMTGIFRCVRVLIQYEPFLPADVIRYAAAITWKKWKEKKKGVQKVHFWKYTMDGLCVVGVSHFLHALLKKKFCWTQYTIFFFFFSILCRAKMLSLRQHLRVSTPSIPGGCDAPGPRSLCQSVSSHWSAQQRRPHGGRGVRFSCIAVKQISTETQPRGRCSACVLPLARPRSHRELGSSAAAVGQQQQAPQTQPRERIAPQQRRRTSEHRLHAFPPQATLPRGLLVFETFDFLREIGLAVNSGSMYAKQNYTKIYIL